MIETRALRFPGEFARMLRGQHRAFGLGWPIPKAEIERARRWRMDVPGFRADLQRVLTVDGRIASGLKVLDLCLRIRSAWVRCAAVADVFTDPDHQRRGYAARLMADAIKLARREGFPISFLGGVPEFYHRLGYATVKTDYEVTVPAAAPLAPAPGWSVRPLGASEIAKALAIHQRESRTQTGVVRRTVRSWQQQDRSGWPGRFRGWALRDPRGVLRGYVRLRFSARHPLELAEIGGLAHAAAVRTALAFAVARARRAGLKTFIARVPPDERVTRWLPACGASVRTSYDLTGGGSMRILNLLPLMRRLRRDLEERLAASPVAGRPTVVALATDIGTVRLTWSGRRLTVDGAAGPAHLTIRLPQQALAPLVFGYTDAAVTAARYGLTLKAQARRILDTLFPRTYAYIWWPDYF